VYQPLLRARSTSLGESLCGLPLLRRSLLGIITAFRLSSNARIACGVVGALIFAGTGRPCLPSGLTKFLRVSVWSALEPDDSPMVCVLRPLGVTLIGVRMVRDSLRN
jgi:hypothetical protein